jgi:hypothetical protein
MARPTHVAGPDRDDGRPVVVLIGFQKIGNLGLGYLSAVLRRAGFDVRVIDKRRSAGSCGMWPQAGR